MNGTATYHLDDDTLRWANDERLDTVTYAEAKKLGFKLWRGSGVWVATWTPDREDFVRRFVPEIEVVDTIGNNEARQTRLAGYAASAIKRSHERAAAARQGLAPMGEPIKVDHHSARRHRRAIERSDQNMRMSVLEDKKAQHWQDKQIGAERQARIKTNPGTVSRRIDRLQADLRRVQGSTRPIAVRWAEHLTRRIAFEQQRLVDLGGVLTPPAESYAVGQQVQHVRWGLCEVIRLGRKNIRIEILQGGAKGSQLLSPPADLKTVNPG